VVPRDKKRSISMSGCPYFNQHRLYFNSEFPPGILSAPDLHLHRISSCLFSWPMNCPSPIYNLAIRCCPQTVAFNPQIASEPGHRYFGIDGKEPIVGVIIIRVLSCFPHSAFGLMPDGEIAGVGNKTFHRRFPVQLHRPGNARSIRDSDDGI